MRQNTIVIDFMPGQDVKYATFHDVQLPTDIPAKEAAIEWGIEISEHMGLKLAAIHLIEHK